MKKVVGLIGSLRKDSLNRVLFNEYKELAKDQFELVEGEIKDLPLYNQELEGKSESARKLATLVAGADGVLFFSPEYNYSIPGVLKNAIDWLSRDERAPFNKKPAAIVGASPGAIGTARMQYHLRQVGVFLNLNFLNKPEVMIGKAMDKIKDGKLVDDSTREFLKKHLHAFAEHMG
ncbi:MAG: NADPH-dependent FMN reductase [Bdellovibrionales bacterium]